MPRTASVVRALLPFALHGLTREVDAALGVILHTTLDIPGLAGQALALVDLPVALGRIALWIASGAGLWVLLAWERSRRDGTGLGQALSGEAGRFGPLYLRPAVTLLALVSVALVPAYPYAFTLPVALTQDWGIGQDAAALAALVALRIPLVRWPAPGAGAVFFVAFLVYALLSPERVRHWDGHPGNEPKYLRMGVSLGHGLSLDVSEVSALEEGLPPMESLEPRPFVPALVSAARSLARESLRMAQALARGPEAVGASSIRARRLARQTIEGKEGGVYHVLAPGPSLLLAPTLRLDRALNLARGTPGRLAVTVLTWNALAAALVAALFVLLRDATGRPGISALLATGLALTPPYLFYFFQFYPEMPGALLLTLALGGLLFRRHWSPRAALGMGLVLAALPWLHQKFLPVWGVLVVMAVVKAVDELATVRVVSALLLPQAVSLYLTALYNFAISGSVRPDALFLAWGPGGVTSARIGEGLFGLLLDARYGIVPYAPFYLLAAAGCAVGARRLLWGLPAVLAYYATVAAADNWSGAVCNLGRYMMPVLPFLAALAAVGLQRAGARRGVLAVALALALWTGLLAVRLWADPRAANDSALLLARSVFADANLYVPNLFYRSWNYAAPGHAARVLAWVLVAAALGLWARRAARDRGGDSPARALAGLGAIVLVAGLALERWPAAGRTPRFHDDLAVGPGALAFVSGAAQVEGDHARARSGDVEILVRSRAPLVALTLWASGDGILKLPGRPPVALPASGARIDVAPEPVCTLVGRRGAQETLSRLRIGVETRQGVVLRLGTGEAE